MISIEKSTFSSYRELLYFGPSGDLLLDVCTLLHRLEMDIRSEMDHVQLDRHIELLHSNLIVKIDLRDLEIMKYESYLTELKMRLWGRMLSIDGDVVLHDCIDNHLQFYVRIPICMTYGHSSMDEL